MAAPKTVRARLLRGYFPDPAAIPAGAVPDERGKVARGTIAVFPVDEFKALREAGAAEQVLDDDV